MKEVLHLATSRDGFIAKLDGDSDWVSPMDEQLFIERAQEAGALVVGRKTFTQYEGKIYPVANTLNIILTRSKEPLSSASNVVIAHTVEEALMLAEKHSAKGLLIAGGAKTAADFLAAGRVQDVFLSVHPIILKKGMKAFGDIAKDTRYRLIEKRTLPDGIEEEHYAMI